MIKSELVQRIAEHNPHLYQRDVENIVNAILDEIVAALARGDRVELDDRQDRGAGDAGQRAGGDLGRRRLLRDPAQDLV